LHPDKNKYTLGSQFQKGEKKVPKVYAVSETAQHNITSALCFGEIETILPPNAQIAFSVVPTIRRIQRKLENFTDDDYLLFIGDPTAIAIISAIASAKNKGRFKCLKWDKYERMYIPIQVDLYPKKGESSDAYDFI
jgi:hypothetical protein